MTNPKDRLRRHVTGAIERGEAEPIIGMDVFTATMIAEGVDEADEEATLIAWQYLVDTGLAWKLQGFFGRTAQCLIDAGAIQPADRPKADA